MLKLSCASAICLAMLLLATGAQADLINFDITGNPDAYGPGAAVYGDASSQWNIGHRFTDFVDHPLFDDTGAATSVTVTTGRTGSGSFFPSGTYQNLGGSHQFSSLVTISGLTPFSAYNLAYFNSASGNWSNLSEGAQYELQTSSASPVGTISFVPTDGKFSAFQLQAVPEPTSCAILGLGFAVLGMRRRR